MDLADHVNTLGQHLLTMRGERVHKVAIDAGFTCPNRDGSKGVGGCTFCNNASFAPAHKNQQRIHEQLQAGRVAVNRVTGANKVIAYFQAYTNTYGDVVSLRELYDEAIKHPNVIGLSVGTRPDCVPDAVLDLLCEYRDQGYIVWLELGLQSAFDETLERVNRGHGFAEYADALLRAQRRGLDICTHLILGLPGETGEHAMQTLQRVLDLGVNGLKLHPLHVVKATKLAYEWRRGQYSPMEQKDYIEQCVELIRHTPPEVIYHRLTGTASEDILLTPRWCSKKWAVINDIATRLSSKGWSQGSALGTPYKRRQLTT